MNKYSTAVDLRRALEDRLKAEAENTGTDHMCLRRIVVFDRIAARLSAAEQAWVLKGGAALEFRLGLRARTTKDLDLVFRLVPRDGAAMRDVLIEALSVDVDLDRFVFTVGHPIALDIDAAGNPGWRFSARTIESAHRRQHFAEKLHALTRDYGMRPNTRVKDLVDLLLLIHDRLLPDRICWAWSGTSSRSERRIRCRSTSPTRHQHGTMSIPRSPPTRRSTNKTFPLPSTPYAPSGREPSQLERSRDCGDDRDQRTDEQCSARHDRQVGP